MKEIISISIWLLVFAVLALFLGNTTISFKPFRIHMERWEYPAAIILLLCAAALIEHYGYKKGQEHSEKQIIERKQ